MGSPGPYGAALKAQSQGMSRFLHTGHHEALLPAQVADQFSLRVWIEMSDLVPLLKRLDERSVKAASPIARSSSESRRRRECSSK